MSILDQADNPRRLVAHDDDSDVSSCAYPYATVLDGIRWWVQRDRLSFPLHGVEDQSRPWGPCITPASGERNCTSTGPKLSKTSSVHVPHPWRMRHFEGTDRSFPLCTALPCALVGRHSHEYYWHSVTLGLASDRPSRVPSQRNVRERRRLPIHPLQYPRWASAIAQGVP